MYILDLLKQYSSIEELPRFANRHGVAAFVYDEVVSKGENPLGTKGLIRLSGYAQKQRKKYDAQLYAIETLARLYSEIGVRMLVFKGYAISKQYDVPENRRCGDVDIYLFGDGEKADKLVQSKGIDVLLQVDKHSAFDWKGVHFENHATFLGVRGSKGMKHVETFLENEIKENCRKDDKLENVYIPCANFDALFIPLHFAGHWVRSELSLRMLYDWAIFLEKRSQEVDWVKIIDVAKVIGFERFLYAMNYCVVKVFGVNENLVGTDKPDVSLAKEIFKDTMFPHEIMEIPNDVGFLKGCWLKSIRYYKLNKRRNKVKKQNLITSFYYHTLSYLHFKTNLDKRTVWEMNYMK